MLSPTLMSFFFFLLSELEKSNHDDQLMGRAGKPHQPSLYVSTYQANTKQMYIFKDLAMQHPASSNIVVAILMCLLLSH